MLVAHGADLNAEDGQHHHAELCDAQQWRAGAQRAREQEKEDEEMAQRLARELAGYDDGNADEDRIAQQLQEQFWKEDLQQQERESRSDVLNASSTSAPNANANSGNGDVTDLTEI